MREILFRGKRVYNGDWVEGYYWNMPNNDHFIRNTEYGKSTDYEVTPESVSQFTGLTDKNGKKIFEGDRNSDGGIIIYDSLARFCINYGSHSISLAFAEKVFEIIGNIHDNPELLNES